MKRLISLSLVVVMLLAMIPAVILTTSAADATEYISVVTSEKIEVDGILDEPYKNSKQITSVKWGTGNSSGLSFVVYTAVTIKGVHVWAEIKDNTLTKDKSHPADNGDKFQIYIRMNNGTDDVWGWYDTDYNGKVSKTVNTGTLADAENVTVKLADGSGWRSETFIPFEGSIDPKILNQLGIYVGFQANNATYNPATDSNSYVAYCYDHSKGNDFWLKNTDYVKLKLFTENDVVLQNSLEKTAVFSTITPNMDGIKDEAYSEYGKVVLSNVIKDSSYTGTEVREDLGSVYILFTTYYLCIYYETEDPDVTSKDYFQMYYEIDNGDTPYSGYFCTKINPVSSDDYFYGSTGQNYGYPGVSYTRAKIKNINAASLGNNKYGLEYKISLTGALRTAISNGTAKIKLDFSANDYASDGTRKFYGGCTEYSSAMYNYNVYGDKLTSVVLNKNFTDSTPGAITGANVALGADITVNYYAVVAPKDVYNSCMRFTQNGKTYIAYPEKSAYPGEYKFAYKGVAPQTVGDNIKAELIVDGVIVATHDNYSVLENCQNIYNDSAYSASTYNNMKMLIKGLLNYSAAAQKYANYKTGDLVNQGHEISLESPSAINSIRDAGTAISDNLKIDALGVYFDSTNKIYAKITATSLAGVTVTINGQPATIEKLADEANRYIVYSEDIPVTQFSSAYRIVLSNGTSSQTVTYSVNSYTYQKYNSETPKVAELAKATFTYGELARKFANLGTSTYKVITFNDADNSYANQKNYEKVAVIINQYAPDVVGMQEVQQKHAKGSTSYYAKLLPDYGIVYYDHGYSSGENSASEALNPSGVPIFYRKDRFTLLSSGNGWLSDTPDKASRYEESDYTRSYVWAKLQDKKTGEIIVAVNTHIDYVLAANIKQINKLLELVASKFPGEHVIMTADWNMGKTYDGYKAMNNAGYFATETLLDDAFTPPTTSGGGYIDFCFVSPDHFDTIDYKVINNHQYSESASDHYAVYSELVIVEKAPEASLSDTIATSFNSPDDNEGF